MGKLYAIGDIHGCVDKFKEMMARIPIDREKDTLIFIGDYVDRGPDPKGVIDTMLSVQQQIRNVVCLMGNHEEMLINYHIAGINEEMFFNNGGHITAFTYGLVKTPQGVKMNVPDDHLRFYAHLLPYYETEDYIFVHGGLRPGIPLSNQDLHDLLWIRDDFITSSFDFGKIVVFGHTPMKAPYMDNRKIGIDTGAYLGRKLTCIELTEMKIYQT